MRIEIVASDDFDTTDIEEIKQMFSNDGFDVETSPIRMVRHSVDIPPAIWIELLINIAERLEIKQITDNEFFTTLFDSIEEYAWSNFKKIIKKILQKRKRNEPTQLRIHVKIQKQIIIILMPDEPEKQEQALNILPKFLDNNPKLNGIIEFRDGQWKEPGDSN